MSLLHALLLVPALAGSPQQTLTDLRGALETNSRPKLEAQFARAGDAGYLLRMAERGGGLRNLKVKVIPAPPGWGDAAKHWAIFHRWQELQQDHDAVYPLLLGSDGFKLGPEIVQSEPSAQRVAHAQLDVSLRPWESKAGVVAGLDLSPANGKRALVFRINENFEFAKASADGKDLKIVRATSDSVPTVQAGEALHAGGLFVVWSSEPVKKIVFDYSATVNQPSQDKIGNDSLFLASNWVPALNRLPFTTNTRITGLPSWTLRSEGNQVSEAEAGFTPLPAQPGRQVVAFKCNIPISFPKVLGGVFQLAAELKEGGRTFRSFQIAPVQPERAQSDVRIMADACRFFSEKLIPFPFDSYECFDGGQFYGIESYSYTVLTQRVTSQFMAHEMAHTYFGGLAPCPYTRDTWNESVTQYVDSVLFSGNRDRTLQNGLRTLGVDMPLNAMDVPWENNNATYMRGAYVMRMLQEEIGLEPVLAGLRDLLTNRRGKDTVWADLLPIFEKSSGKELDWFWRQWIEGSKFPEVKVVEAVRAQTEQTYRTNVVIAQSGTPTPFRLRVLVRVRRGPETAEQSILLTSPQGGVTIASTFQPTEAEVVVFPTALAAAGGPVPVTGAR